MCTVKLSERGGGRRKGEGELSVQVQDESVLFALHIY